MQGWPVGGQEQVDSAEASIGILPGLGVGGVPHHWLQVLPPTASSSNRRSLAAHEEDCAGGGGLLGLVKTVLALRPHRPRGGDFEACVDETFGQCIPGLALLVREHHGKDTVVPENPMEFLERGEHLLL